MVANVGTETIAQPSTSACATIRGSLKALAPACEIHSLRLPSAFESRMYLLDTNVVSELRRSYPTFWIIFHIFLAAPDFAHSP